MRHRQLAIAFLFLMAAAPVPGQVPPGRWEKVERLQPGSSINVRLKTGDRFQGAFKSIDPDSIELIDESSRARRIPKPIIERVETVVRQPDRLCNGALIGALAGIGAGVASMVAYGNAKTNGPVHWGDEDAPGYLVGAVLVGGGIGGAAGALIDASLKHPYLLYQK